MMKNIFCILVLMMFASCLSTKIGLVESYSDDSITTDSAKSYVSHVSKIVDSIRTEKLAMSEKSEKMETIKTVSDVKEEKLTPIVDKMEKVEAMKPTIILGSIGGGRSSNYPTKEIQIVQIVNTKTVKQSSDLAQGRIVYNIPDKMKVRTTYKVVVRISKSKAIVTMTDNLTGVVMTSEIPITESMEVKIVDSSPTDRKVFEIVGDNNRLVQLIDNDNSYTEWSWDVTPVYIGDAKLKIVVSIIRNGNTKDVVYEDTIDVETDAIAQATFFVEENWQWLSSTIAIPFCIWYYQKKRKRKK